MAINIGQEVNVSNCFQIWYEHSTFYSQTYNIYVTKYQVVLV